MFRQRLIGELFGDADIVAATFDPAFEVVIHAGETSVTLPGTAIADGVRVQASAGVLMWTEFDDLVTDTDSIAASGAMLNLHLEDRVLTSTPVSLVLRFSGERMLSEVVFMGRTTIADVSADPMPSIDTLRAQLDS